MRVSWICHKVSNYSKRVSVMQAIYLRLVSVVNQPTNVADSALKHLQSLGTKSSRFTMWYPNTLHFVHDYRISISSAIFFIQNHSDVKCFTSKVKGSNESHRINISLSRLKNLFQVDDNGRRAHRAPHGHVRNSPTSNIRVVRFRVDNIDSQSCSIDMY